MKTNRTETFGFPYAF